MALRKRREGKHAKKTLIFLTEVLQLLFSQHLLGLILKGMRWSAQSSMKRARSVVNRLLIRRNAVHRTDFDQALEMD